MQPINGRRWIWVFVVIAVCVFAVGCGKADDKTKQAKQGEKKEAEAVKPLDTSSDKVIATYEGVTEGQVTEGEFNKTLNVLSVVNPQMAMFIDQPEMKEQLLKQYIARKSIAPKVKTTRAMDEQADEFIQLFKQQFQGERNKKEAFASFLKEKGFSEKDLHEFVINITKVDSYFQGQLTDEDVKNGYDDLKREKDLRLYNAKIRHILVQVNEEQDDKKARERADEVKARLDQGGDFGKLAKKYSDDPGSKDKGGALSDEMIPLVDPMSPLEETFAKAVRDLPLKQVSEPVKTPFGYHIIEVLEREELTFEQAKDIVKNDLSQKQYEQYVSKDLKIEKKV